MSSKILQSYRNTCCIHVFGNPTWRIIPISKNLATTVIVVTWGYGTPSKWPLMASNRLTCPDHVSKSWDDPPSFVFQPNLREKLGGSKTQTSSAGGNGCLGNGYMPWDGFGKKR